LKGRLELFKILVLSQLERPLPQAKNKKTDFEQYKYNPSSPHLSHSRNKDRDIQVQTLNLISHRQIIQTMATPSFALSLLMLFLAMPYSSLSCPTPCECEINLQLYLHQIVQGEPDHNQVVVISPPIPEPEGFGTLVVVDWTVIDAIRPNANIIARAKGMVVQASIGVSGSWFNYFSVVFQDASR
jgi:hypothetical protein